MSWPILVGFQSRAVRGFERVVRLPPPPEELSPEELEAWRTDELGGMAVMRRAADEAAMSAVTGRLSRIFAVDPGNQSVLDTKGDDRPAAVQFLDWLLAAHPLAFPAALSDARRGVSLWGFDIAAFVRVLGAECRLRDASVPVGLWVGNRDCHDPYELVVEPHRRESLPLSSLLLSLGIDVPAAWRPHRDPRRDASLVAELMGAFGLRSDDEAAPLVERLEHPLVVATPGMPVDSPDEEADEADADEPAEDTTLEEPIEEEEEIPEPTVVMGDRPRRRRMRG